MYFSHKQGVPWPPRGWPHFNAIKKLTGQAMSKDPKTAQIKGLNYTIEPTVVYSENNKKTISYHFRIFGWFYSIRNDSYEFPILEFDLLPRDDALNGKAPFISNVRVKGTQIALGAHLDESKAHRIIMVSLFLLKQISSGNVPDFDQALSLYRLNGAGKKRVIIRSRLFSSFEKAYNDKRPDNALKNISWPF